eukprot:TRINITY_DN61192_c0_g1_i2.p3 TRINITY_DN61192_c0_g1~~TRINITY_DN61192_c0_g1_i2.p3  ORF type:complete len:142 (+),score=34.61 TRINITY_DN61192_c0_g1_i2:1-426(+)
MRVPTAAHSSMSTTSTIRGGSAQEVYSQLKSLILGFEIYPGSRVTETELAERFGVSRTPVREALQRLQLEGYLSVRPKQGCFIREIDIEEIDEHYQVRIALEMCALEVACIHMPDKAIRELEIGRAVQQECRDRSRMPSSA